MVQEVSYLFDWERFKGNNRIGVICKNTEEALKFSKMMHDNGMVWYSGRRFDDEDYVLKLYKNGNENFIIFYGMGTHGSYELRDKKREFFDFSETFKDKYVVELL